MVDNNVAEVLFETRRRAGRMEVTLPLEVAAGTEIVNAAPDGVPGEELGMEAFAVRCPAAEEGPPMPPKAALPETVWDPLERVPIWWTEPDVSIEDEAAPPLEVELEKTPGIWEDT